MRYSIALFLLLICLIPQVCAKKQVPQQEKVLESSVDEIDFDTISFTKKSKAIFLLKSTGINAVTITNFNIKTDDTDFSISVPATPLILKPGSTTIVAVVFDPTCAGTGTAKFIVSTDSKTTPKVVIKIKASAYDPTMNNAKINNSNSLENVALHW